MLTTRQQKQLAIIDQELAHHRARVVLQEMHNTICVSDGETGVSLHDFVMCVEQEVKQFGIIRSADYLHKVLNRAGIYGIAIRSPRDEPDREFGEFVAKARLLKHLKEVEKMVRLQQMIPPPPYIPTEEELKAFEGLTRHLKNSGGCDA